MIRYRAGIGMLLQIWHGSVFPAAFRLAAVCAILAAVPMILAKNGFEAAIRLIEECQEINFSVYAGFTSLIGFLVVFRTSIAYQRFWNGATFLNQMNADWFEAASSLVAFCSGSKATTDEIMLFKHTIVRLFSLLHALALAELEAGHEGSGGEEGHGEKHLHELQTKITKRQLHLIDPLSLDSRTLQAMVDCHNRVELVIHWIQKLVLCNLQNGVLCAPPPIISRAYQELSNGTVKLHNALTIAEVPFPFPYAQANLALLTAHWVLAPLAMCGVAKNAVLAGLYCFSQTFILWSLYWTAVELEEPFGDDANDLDLGVQQDKLNSRLQMLIHDWTAVVPSCPKILESDGSPTSTSHRGDDSPDVSRLVHMQDVFSFDNGKGKRNEFQSSSTKARLKGTSHNLGDLTKDLDDTWNLEMEPEDELAQIAVAGQQGNLSTALQKEARSGVTKLMEVQPYEEPPSSASLPVEERRPVEVTDNGRCPCYPVPNKPGVPKEFEEIDPAGSNPCSIHKVSSV